jgi:hypothetical protein
MCLAWQAVINDIRLGWSDQSFVRIEGILQDNSRTRALLHHLAGRPGHDEVKSDFRQLLVEEFGVELGAMDFERRVPEVRGRLGGRGQSRLRRFARLDVGGGSSLECA